MKQYLDLVDKILRTGEWHDDRTGTGTYRIFGEQVQFDFADGFPAVTTKKLAWKSVVSELLWFLKGSTNVNELRAILHGEENRFNLDKKTIWDANYEQQGKALGYVDGELGPVYGGQWRDYNGQGVDQVRALITAATHTPNSRRLLVNAWNPVQIPNMTLPPCHYGFQVNVRGDFVDLLWTQRSVDVFLGLPFNIASYGLLLLIFARILGKKPGTLTGQLGDCHIYSDHVEQMKEQLFRKPFLRPNIFVNPDLNTLEDFENASVGDFVLIGYEHHPALTGAMAV